MRRRFSTVCLLSFAIFLTAASQEKRPYRRWIRGRTTLYSDHKDFGTGEEVLSLIESHAPEIETFLHLEGAAQITVVIAPTPGEFERLTAGQIPEWGAGAADPSRGLLILKSPRIVVPDIKIDRIVIHELCHILLNRALRSGSVDRWFDEGFAQYFSGDHRPGSAIRMGRSLLTNQFIALEDIDEVLSFQRDKAALAYAESRAAFGFLVERHGNEAVASIVRSLSEDRSMGESFEAILGIGIREFEADWIQDLKRKTRWVVLLDIPLLISILFLSLFFAAAVKARKKIRLKRMETEEEPHAPEAE